MNSSETRLLTKQQVASLLGVEECIAAVEGVFNLHGNKKAQPPGILGMHTQHGGFHIKAGTLNLGRTYFVTKVNANFPSNPILNSLPTIQGAIALFDGDDGRLLALMDSSQVTILRTGAATAVAAKYLARRDSRKVAICGCGNQGRISLRSLASIFSIERVFAYDINDSTLSGFVKEMSASLSIEIVPTQDIGNAVKNSDICVTCTPSTQPILNYADVPPGTFIAAVGADSEHKQELDPELVASSKLIVDIREQCASIGELHHAISKKLLTIDQVHAELGEVIAGRVAGRETDEEIIIFDSTGMALQDVAAAAIVYERATHEGVGTLLNFMN